MNLPESFAVPTVFSWPVRVYYEDTDAAGVVYYANYLKYLERARTEWLRAGGIAQEAYFQRTGLRFAVVRLEIDFRAPARLDDALEVSVWIERSRRATLDLGQRIERAAGAGPALITATVRLACVDERFRPQRLPADILACAGIPVA
ncbi:MAG: tol-pal system-associated acyl-CoA thioesterase [Magnetococcales bacterium]|nr:tol-pal system-associated acyl-CoA thioesterase [Magnetococcales bacterium]